MHQKTGEQRKEDKVRVGQRRQWRRHIWGYERLREKRWRKNNREAMEEKRKNTDPGLHYSCA